MDEAEHTQTEVRPPNSVDDNEDPAADDYSNDHVPLSARVPRFTLTMSGWSMITGMAWLFFGALAGTLYGTRQALVGLTVFTVGFAVLNSPMVRIGALSGLSSTLVSRRLFGKAGGMLIAVLVGATTIYYAVFESSVVAVGFHEYWGGDLRLWSLVVVLAMLPLMMGGVLTWMHKLNGILLPVYIVGMVAAVILAAKNGNPTEFLDFPGVIPPEARGIPGWLAIVLLYLGVSLNMISTLDFARFSRLEDIGYHQRITFGWVFSIIVFPVTGAAGMFLAQMAFPGSVPTEAGVVVGLIGTLGFAGLVLIVATQIRINTLNFYMSSMNAQRLIYQLSGRRVGRKPLVVASAVLVFVLMLTDVFSYMEKALQWQSIFFAGWVAIVLTHVLIAGSGALMGDVPRRVPSLRPATVVWTISAAVGISLLESPSLWATGSNIAPIITILVAVVGYVPFAVRSRSDAGAASTAQQFVGAADD